MSVVAAAIIGSTVVGGVTAIASSSAQVGAAERGIESNETLSRENIELQKELAAEQRADLEPWRQTGINALEQIEAGVEAGDFTMEDYVFEADPGYQFRLQEGIDARDKSAAARGRLNSGAQARAIERYGQDYASNEYSNAYAREANDRARRYNILSGLSQGGQSSAARQAAATSQLGQTSSNILTNLGASNTSAYNNIGAARASGYAGIGTSINQAAQNWLTYKNVGA